MRHRLAGATSQASRERVGGRGGGGGIGDTMAGDAYQVAFVQQEHEVLLFAVLLQVILHMQAPCAKGVPGVEDLDDNV